MISRHPILFSFLFVGLVFGALVFVFVMFLGFSGQNTGIFPFGDIAILKLEGPIFESTDMIKKIDHVRKDKSIKAVVMRIDSPGGGVAPSQEIFEELKKLKKEKTVVISMGTLAASGGYYIASASHKILAQAGTVTGSIGVIMEGFDVQQLVEWAHLKSRVLKSGKYKDAGSLFREMTPEERTYLQNILDGMYLRFKKDVAEQRNIPLERIDELAEGKIYTGEQALELKLIDGLGTLFDAIEEAKKLAGLPENASVIWPREEGGPLGLFSSFFDQETAIDKKIKKYMSYLGVPIGFYQLPEWVGAFH